MPEAVPGPGRLAESWPAMMWPGGDAAAVRGRVRDPGIGGRTGGCASRRELSRRDQGPRFLRDSVAQSKLRAAWQCKLAPSRPHPKSRRCRWSPALGEALRLPAGSTGFDHDGRWGSLHAAPLTAGAGRQARALLHTLS